MRINYYPTPMLRLNTNIPTLYSIPKGNTFVRKHRKKGIITIKQNTPFNKCSDNIHVQLILNYYKSNPI